MNPRRTIAEMIVCTAILCFVSPRIAQGRQAPSTSGQPAPVPVQITSAQKVFIANGGEDLTSEQYFKKDGDPNLAYDRFYAALKNSARFDLAPSPADADLVLEIRFEAPIVGFGNTASYALHFQLKILDAKTHFLLWAMVSPVEGAWRKSTFEKNFSTALDNLMKDLGDLAGPRPQAAK